MRTTQKETELRTIPLFAACTREELRLVARMVETVDVRPGTQLCREGRRAGQFVAVVSGTAVVTEDGRPVAMLAPGGHTGEVDVLLREDSERTVTATTHMRVVVCDPRRFMSLVEIAPTVARRLLVGLAGRVRYVSASTLSAAAMSDV